MGPVSRAHDCGRTPAMVPGKGAHSESGEAHVRASGLQDRSPLMSGQFSKPPKDAASTVAPSPSNNSRLATTADRHRGRPSADVSAPSATASPASTAAPTTLRTRAGHACGATPGRPNGVPEQQTTVVTNRQRERPLPVRSVSGMCGCVCATGRRSVVGGRTAHRADDSGQRDRRPRVVGSLAGDGSCAA